VTSFRSIAVSFVLLVGCGGPASTVDPNEAFRQIQVHEATIAHGAAEAERCGDEESCGAELELCAAVTDLCRVSRSIDDPDARTRCRMARRHCPEAP